MSDASVAPIYLAGPTASGKSAVALEIAQRMEGEVITVDSMQVYRGLDIGTAKPTSEEQRGVPHHLIDIVELNESFDAARFVSLAQTAEAEIRRRGKIPIYCGGTGMYFKALIHGVGEAPSSDPNLRAELESLPLEDLLLELKREDPQTFNRVDQQNPRRVVRAVEAIRLSGRPFSEQQSTWSEANEGFGHFFALAREPDDLRARIDLRVEKMISDGLIPETEALMKIGLEHNRTAMQAIGYRQVVEHLRGERSLKDTVELIKAKTWQLARRQMTWLRNQLRPRWITVSSEATSRFLGDTLIKNLRHQP